ncbi:MAG: transcriptional regulator [Clostridiales bacterium]|nr:transcriptional regulator [Clostridiales bacterium]
MQFYEKLDFLMNITNTTNSALSLYINLDSSHISRLRRGKRNAVKDENSLRLMAEFFTRRCVADYQRKALADVLNIDLRSLDTIGSYSFILDWLIEEKKEDAKKIEIFLNHISNISTRQFTSENAAFLPTESSVNDTEIYFGLEGKRLAVENFLSEVIAQEQSQSLLLYSDEPTDWLTSDRKFVAKWTELMLQVLSKGNRIKIIHTVSRDLDEMLCAINQWMPLYMSGLIEPYYYPKKRDGVFKRSLFVAPGTAAVTSSTTGDMINKAVNFYTKNREAVLALTEEFNQYISLCKPLMKIFTPHEKTSCINTILEFEKERTDCIIITESLSLLTMPDSLSSKVISRITDTNLNYNKLSKNRILNFKQQLKDNSFFEIIKIVDSKSIIKGEVTIAASDMLCGQEMYYTLEEYISHLENIQRLLDAYPNFNIYLTKKALESRCMIYVKENLGAIITKTSEPPVVLAFDESNLSAVLWDYLISLIGEKSFQSPDKKESSDKLKEYINLLKQNI